MNDRSILDDNAAFIAAPMNKRKRWNENVNYEDVMPAVEIPPREELDMPAVEIPTRGEKDLDSEIKLKINRLLTLYAINVANEQEIRGIYLWLYNNYY